MLLIIQLPTFEFLSCIPGSIGGAIIMNSGCYGDEISNILISIKAIDFNCKIKEFKRDQIKFIIEVLTCLKI